MEAARPFHINHPRRYADGTVAESERFYEVVGHRDGPVVAIFFFSDKESEELALRLATMVVNSDVPHRIGNPLFAIETNLDPLRRRISNGESASALRIVDEISASVEKAKAALNPQQS